MNPTTLSCLLLFTLGQDARPVLTAGKPLAGHITTALPPLASRTLERRFGPGAIRKQTFGLQLETPSEYAITAASSDFDPWLVVRAEDGSVLAEVAGTTGRAAIVVLPADASLRVDVAALRGGEGTFTVACEPATALHRQRARLASAWAKLEAAERASGPEGGLDVAVSASALAALLEELGEFRAAEELHRRVLALVETSQGPDHLDVATAQNNLAIVLFRQASYGAAEELHRQALAMRQKLQGADHPDVATSLNNLALVLAADGRHREAESFHRQALGAWEKAYGPDHIVVAKSVLNLAQTLQARGRYAEAEPLFRRAVATFERLHGPNHPIVGQALYNLGNLLCLRARFAEAGASFERAAAILEAEYGPQHREVAMALSNLATNLEMQGRHADAEPPGRRALSIFEAAHDPNHPSVATASNNLARTLQSLGRLAEAERLYGRAAAIQEKVLGPAHPHLAITLNNVALLCLARGDAAATEPLYRRSLAIQQNVYGADHPFVIQAQANLLRMVQDLGRHDEAWQLARRITEAGEAHVLQELSRLPADDRFLVSAAQAGRLDHLLSCARATGDPAALAEAWCHVTAWKGLVFRLARRVAARDAESQRTRALRGDLQSLSAQLAQLAYAREIPDLDRHRSHFEDLLGQRRTLQGELMATLGIETDRERTSAPQIGKLLPANAALLDFLVHRPFRFGRAERGKLVEAGRWEPPRLWCFVVRSAATEPVQVDLGPLEDLRTIIERWLGALAPGQRGGPLVDGPDPIAAVRQRLWEPVARHLTGVDLVFVSAEDVLAQVPFGAIEVAPGRHAIELARFVSVSDPVTLRDLLERGPRPRAGPPAFLGVGAIDYQTRAGSASDLVALRGGRGFDRAWQTLPASGPEVEAVRQLWRQRFPDTAADVLRGPDSTEEALVQLAAGRSVLHLATHGFFERNGVASLWESALSRLRDAPLAPPLRIGDPLPDRMVIEPLAGEPPGLLAGLILAGANQAPPPGRADGILTADEASTLPLGGCELVVLSACETELGSARSGEGLVSLRRAFAEAGAQTVISTLWRVDDEATRACIETFYRGLWQTGLSPAEALRRAQLWMLSGGGKSEWRAPRFWGAWLVAGEWR